VTTVSRWSHSARLTQPSRCRRRPYNGDAPPDSHPTRKSAYLPITAPDSRAAPSTHVAIQIAITPINQRSRRKAVRSGESGRSLPVAARSGPSLKSIIALSILRCCRPLHHSPLSFNRPQHFDAAHFLPGQCPAGRTLRLVARVLPLRPARRCGTDKAPPTDAKSLKAKSASVISTCQIVNNKYASAAAGRPALN